MILVPAWSQDTYIIRLRRLVPRNRNRNIGISTSGCQPEAVSLPSMDRDENVPTQPKDYLFRSKLQDTPKRKYPCAKLV